MRVNADGSRGERGSATRGCNREASRALQSIGRAPKLRKYRYQIDETGTNSTIALMAKRQNPTRPPRTVGRREEILDGLEGIFLKEGFRKVTIGELAVRMRCSRRAFYEVAGSKDKLFLAVLDRLLARIRAMGEEACSAHSQAGAQLEAFLEPGFAETLNASTNFFGDIESYPPAKRIMDEHQATRAEGIKAIIQQGVRDGELRRVNPQLVTEIARVVSRRLKDPEFLRAASLSAGEAFRDWTDLLLHGLLSPKAAGKRKRPRVIRG